MRRPFDGAEEATGDAVLQPRLPLDDATLQKRRRFQLIHQPIDGAADAFHVGGFNGHIVVDGDAIGLRPHGFSRLDDSASHGVAVDSGFGKESFHIGVGSFEKLLVIFENDFQTHAAPHVQTVVWANVAPFRYKWPVFL